MLPALHAAGWTADQIIEQYPITTGGSSRPEAAQASRPLRADYVLEYRPGVPVAVVEAKRLYKKPGDGMQQGKRYARLLDLARLRTRATAKELSKTIGTRDHEAFPAEFASPEDAWQRFRAFKGITTDAEAAGFLVAVQPRASLEHGGHQRAALLPARRDQPHVQSILSGDQALASCARHGHWQDVRRDADHLEVVERQVVRRSESARALSRGPQHPHRPADHSRVQTAFGEGPIHKFEGATRHGRELYFGPLPKPHRRRRRAALTANTSPTSSTSSSSTNAIAAARTPTPNGAPSSSTSRQRRRSA